ncbi:hypothetical protein VA596_38875 [Amycolatopsis sp., V23-08]|uniref:Uncharacterized protein n=1 Tax=Amycolatopsis heterodermiae TaxID=3110235 RepID=A0ABU5RGZ9_9PSEU|nr:hypothetical protein [Amycolatopsis sp., V23-08]MEA5365543.1 hypothetical protein [Amycolatopsis sp., V23-08]
MSSIMMRIGILFAVLGFGTFVLEQFDMEFRLLSWADDMQPTFGIVLGLVGVALIIGALVLGRSKATPQPQQQFAQQPPAPGYPGQPQQQYPGQAPQQQPYAQQQYPQQPGQPGQPR